MKNTLPKAPDHLSPPAAAWWDRIVSGWDLDPAALLVLTAALESFDRMTEAQEVIRRDGSVIEDRFGIPKQHPATYIERDSRSSMLRAIKQLGLDLEPLQAGPGRPPGS